MLRKSQKVNTVSVYPSLGGQRSFPNFEKVGIRQNECLGNLNSSFHISLPWGMGERRDGGVGGGGGGGS